MTIKDMKDILGFLEIAQRVTERNIRESKEGSTLHECFTSQLERLNDLIKRLEETEI